jgi:ribonuclease III
VKPLLDLQERLAHRFSDPALLERALTHSSRSRESARAGPDNEPLEFLGDAILGFLIAEMLHRLDPDGDEGGKSKRRAALVSARSLARHAAALGIPKLLRLGRGEEKAGGREKTGLWADAYEALLAAIYLDGGFAAARRFIEKDFAPDFSAGVDRAAVDHKSALQERLQARGLPVPEYALVEERGPAHRKSYVVECRIGGAKPARGEGYSKKEAQQDAARKALLGL